MMDDVDPLVIAVLAVVVIAVVATVAPRLRIAGPILLTVLGLGVSLLPWVDVPQVDPEIILVVILPPLLYSAAVQLPAIEFRRDFGPIAGLAVLLVILTSVALAFLFTAAVPGLGILLALALGAILSPTDAVATSIVKRLGISRRTVTMVEGESLLNDATSLVILRTAVAAVAVTATTTAFPAGDFLTAFGWGVLIAVVVGAVIGWLNLRLRALIGNSAANTAVGFTVPFVAYLPTETLGGSGLVAAVVAGIVTGQGAARRFSPEQRISDELNWRTAELVLEGAVFLIMGLEVFEILQDNDEESISRAAWLAAAAFVIIMLVRTGFVSALFLAQGRRARRHQRRKQHLEHLSKRLDAVESGDSPRVLRRPRAEDPERVAKRIASFRGRISRSFADLDYYRHSPLGWRHGTVVVWAGMRGVVTLAAAQTLPRETAERPLVILVAFFVAVGSLLLQGSTLPWLVRLLRLDGTEDDSLSREEQQRIRDELRRAAASALGASDLAKRDGVAFDPSLVERVGAQLEEPPDDERTAAARDILELRIVVLEAMRTRLTELSSDGAFSSQVLGHTLAELDADQLSIELRLDDAG